MSIFVEREMPITMEHLWELTQDPAMHQRWDLRFSRIAYLPKRCEADPQAFTYEKRLGFGLVIRGTGETRGERQLPDRSFSSSLTFGSNDPRSLIRKGSGFWRYEPTANGVRFITA